MKATGILAIVSRADAKAQGLKRFFTGKPCIHGHIAERLAKGVCVECNRIRALETYYKNIQASRQKKNAAYKANPFAQRNAAKEWRKSNPQASAENSRQYYLTNKEKIKARSIAWSSANREKKNAANLAWNKANKEKSRAHQRDYEKKKRDADPVYAMRERIQCSIRNSLIKGGFTKISRTGVYLGCTFEMFKVHLEKQFLKGMTWENRREWHIDHITPTSSAKTVGEMAALHHFTNLRPMWAAANQSKGDKIEYLI